ncbi:hypothetical protein CVIRNUC_000472 [Coccomyxa viridis]|uniref:Sucrase/ferredoxin-like-domain-containing protein n=1 Tax=Coccomyxa viridis TaxID=1274662 RepID=A0AAV1HRZ2_9CHLO|nr:hypothetical protein CVIRNUC_000472 [Coccomyxa viridis]
MLRQAWRRSIAPFETSQAFRTSLSSRGSERPSDSTSLETKAPKPGTVSPYEHHIFLRFPPKLVPDAGPGSWWPKIVERMPEFLQAFAAVAANRKHIEGVVRISAYEDADPTSHPQSRPGKCDMMLFPSGAWLKGLDQDAVPKVITSLVAEPGEGDLDFKPPPLNKSVQSLARSTPPVSLFVCTHGSRDCRCGTIGATLVERLDSIVAERGLQGSVGVFRCSHIGGHKYAGNVLVYGPASPCDGDWYGGVTADCAEAFLDALMAADVGGHGGVGSAPLRPLWRGRMGLSKAEQLQAFEDGALPEEDLQTEEDWEYVGEAGKQKLNGSAQAAGIPLAEITRDIFSEHGKHEEFSDMDTPDPMSEGELEYTSSVGSDFSTSSSESESSSLSDSKSDTDKEGPRS